MAKSILAAALVAIFFGGAAPVAVVSTTTLIASTTMVEAKAKCPDGSPLTSRCTTATDQTYGGGGHNPKTVPIEACLDGRMAESIRLPDGTSFWEVGFYYGGGQPEVVTTVRNDACWTHARSGKRQTGAPGAWVVAFICCDYYCGWVGGQIGRDGKVALRPMNLPRQHDPLASHKLPSGEYDRARLLK